MSRDDALLRLLEKATVRIDIRGEPSGTGFFVAAGHVLTCTHVVEATHLSSTASWSDVKIIDAEGVTHALTDQSRTDATTDLALLRLATAPPSAPSVHLDETVEVDDRLYAYGFPKNLPYGSPGTYVAEGFQGGPPMFIKFKEGEVRPGMSGAPLLNRRTGAVCGVLRRTRGEATDLGGYGIPVGLLPRAQGLEDLLDKNSQTMLVDQRWREALSAEQRSLLGLHAPRRNAKSQDFVIDVGQCEDRWWISANVYPENEKLGSVPVDLNVVRTDVARLFRLWKSHGRLGEDEQAQLLGTVLAKAVLPGAVGARFEELLQQDISLDVALHFQEGIDLDLIHMPWEQLYASERPNLRRGTAIGANRGMTLTRVANPEPADSQAPVRESLSVLLITPPSSRTSNDYAGDVRQTLQNITGAVAVDGGSPSDESLLDKLNETSPDVLHYVGYGRYENSRDQLALAGEEHGEPYYLAPDEFADSIGDASPQVVILQPCEEPLSQTSQAPQVSADFAVFATQLLLLRNVKAVVAFQLPLTDREDARKFLGRFYKTLAEGASIRTAVQEGRIPLRRKRPWAMPALFTRHPGDMRLVTSRRSAGSGPRSRWGATNG
jgi:hypothetical protein